MELVGRALVDRERPDPTDRDHIVGTEDDRAPIVRIPIGGDQTGRALVSKALGDPVGTVSGERGKHESTEEAPREHLNVGREKGEGHPETSGARSDRIRRIVANGVRGSKTVRVIVEVMSNCVTSIGSEEGGISRAKLVTVIASTIVERSEGRGVRLDLVGRRVVVSALIVKERGAVFEENEKGVFSGSGGRELHLKSRMTQRSLSEYSVVSQ